MPQASAGKNITSSAQLNTGVISTDDILDEDIGIIDIGPNAVGDSEVAAHTTTKITVPLSKIGAGTQGGVPYFGAAGAPTELAAGTSGQFLKTLGAGANPLWSDLSSTDVQIFTTSGTWTKPTGALAVFVYLFGGGGAGGGSNGGNQGGGGGGGGGSARKVFGANALGATEAITIGAGGTGVSDATGASWAGGNVAGAPGLQPTSIVNIMNAAKTPCFMTSSSLFIVPFTRQPGNHIML